MSKSSRVFWVESDRPNENLVHMLADGRGAPWEPISPTQAGVHWLPDSGCGGWYSSDLSGTREAFRFSCAGPGDLLDGAQRVVDLFAEAKKGLGDKLVSPGSVLVPDGPNDFRRCEIQLARARFLSVVVETVGLSTAVNLATHDSLIAASLDHPGKISFSDKEANRYHATRRKASTLGRWLARHGKSSVISSVGVESVTAMLTGPDAITVDILDTPSEVDQEDWPEWGSCMHVEGRDTAKLVAWYDDIKGCQAIGASIGERKVCRALLWKGKYIDRIYGTPLGVRLLKQWAVKHGYMTLDSQTYGRVWHVDGVAQHLEISVDLPKDGFPYLDSLRYLHQKNGKYTISTYKAWSWKTLDRTDGGPNLVEAICSSCDRAYDPESEGAGEFCPSCEESRSCCERCNNNYWSSAGREVDGELVCPACSSESLRCAECRTRTFGGLDDDDLCENCQQESEP
jgi:hypothetical protein